MCRTFTEHVQSIRNHSVFPAARTEEFSVLVIMKAEYDFLIVQNNSKDEPLEITLEKTTYIIRVCGNRSVEYTATFTVKNKDQVLNSNS